MRIRTVLAQGLFVKQHAGAFDLAFEDWQVVEVHLDVTGATVRVDARLVVVPDADQGDCSGLLELEIDVVVFSSGVEGEG